MTILDIILLTTVTICLITDIQKQKIYNKVLLPALILGMAGNIIVNGFPGLQSSFLGLLLGMGLLILPFFAGGIGAGDVKLMGVIGILKGPAFVFQAFLATAVVGGIIAVTLLFRRRAMINTLRRMGTALKSMLLMVPQEAVTGELKSSTAISFPYGIAISIGTIVAYFVA